MKIKNYLKTCDQIYHTTLDPKTPETIRIHLVPPKKLKPGIPWVVIINGYYVLPLQTSWAILLKEFMESLNQNSNHLLTEEDMTLILDRMLRNVKKVFFKVKNKTLKSDLLDILDTIKKIAYGEKPSEEIGYMTLAKYGKYMKAPHRMDLMISAMEKQGNWNCNQKCLHCYAAHEIKSNVEELTKEQWKNAIDACKSAGIPALTFTGGEPTLREDLVELIDHAKWFVTRLNTNGILLTKTLCKELYEASLDSVQITLYSYDEEIHNRLVGGNYFRQTVEGIKNAIAAGLDVSINTPLCKLNEDYIKTIEFAHALGVGYFSCSGLILTGNAKKYVQATALTKEEILKIVTDAKKYMDEIDKELSFTSPGWIKEDELKRLKLSIPSCGACLSNMAIAPNGDVIPCQSWLSGLSLGNILSDKFKKIWSNDVCKNIRIQSMKNENQCPLRGKENETNFN